MTRENPISTSGGDTRDGVAIESEECTDVIVPCPTCKGQGRVFLHYLEEYTGEDGDQADRWLLCSDCNGAGEVPESEIADRQSTIPSRQGQGILYELYRVVVEGIFRDL